VAWATLRTQPGVRSVASASTYPLDGILPGVRLRTAADSNLRAAYNVVSPDYFATLGIPLVRGRMFSESDARDLAPVVLVSEGTAARFWPGQDPVGQPLTIADSIASRGSLSSHRDATVIGVVRDAAPGWIGLSPHDPVVYYPQSVDAPAAAILVRVAGSAGMMRDRLDGALAAADSGAVQEIHTLDASLAVQSYPFLAAYWVSSAVGLLALLLTLTGVYGVLGYVVAQRAREFGIRMALGASPPSLITLVLGHSMRLALVGFAIGGVLALGVSRAFASLLYGIDTFDPLGYGIGALVVVGACFVASYLPSRRAARVNPVEALRADS
jgi:hypothetical protein